jgi:predicted CXXCH cytochrome family protein
MWKSAPHYLTLFRTGLSWGGLGLAVVLLLASCDETKRHETLTFFFDGVPPLPGEMPAGGPGGADLTGPTASSRAGGWYVHEAVKDCTQCHGARRQRTLSRQAQLVAEVPQLCYNCHGEFAALEGWVHGPVATGECLICHEPHKTKNEFLLLKPAPELCYQCHDVQAIESIENHAEDSYARCIDCHAGHAAATRNLLRPEFLARPAARTYRLEVNRRQYEVSLTRARDDLARGQGFLAMSQTIMDYIEKDRLWAARAYLEIVADSAAVTDQERLKLGEALRLLVALTEVEPAERPESPGGAASLAAAKEAVTATLRAIRDQRGERERAVAELYYRSIRLYHAGQLEQARAGFCELLANRFLLGPMRQTAEAYLEKIEQTLKEPR